MEFLNQIVSGVGMKGGEPQQGKSLVCSYCGGRMSGESSNLLPRLIGGRLGNANKEEGKTRCKDTIKT